MDISGGGVPSRGCYTGTWAELLLNIGRLVNMTHQMRKLELSDCQKSDLLSIESEVLYWSSDGMKAGITTKMLGGVVGTVIDSIPNSKVELSTGDISAAHCSTMAQAYGLTALLQLYHSCIFVLYRRLSFLPEIQSSKKFIQMLSSSVVALLKQIPITSRLFSVC
jgi:hypothetical protein